ncbi:MAG: hypothetical protein CME17_06890 [Gemmatimonadetes bacterium]|nr:hypothetical protein [Gemmatimonadota bacterium]|tara:strand:+ start:4986 stop:6917 length:1932 start_codon:yes stop_codon:yes gene_type:complete
MVLSAEEQRQRDLSDGNFVKNELYFFELTIPGDVTRTGNDINAITPLLINPESITMTEPYAVTPTATVGGGLYVEEDGVIARQLHIRGTTGFKPRSAAGIGFGTPAKELNTSEKLSFPMRGNLKGAESGPLAFSGQSGQRQFQFLQDRIFRLYSDLKQNPDCSANTKLTFHNPKDQEHWRVVPLSFTMHRATPRSTMYMYDIQLLVVERATNKKPIKVLQRPDNAIVQAINNTSGAVRNTMAYAEGALKNIEGYVTALNDVVGNIQGTFNSVTSTIRGYERLLGKVENAVQGVVNIGVSAVNSATSLIDAGDAILDAIDSWGGAKAGIYNVEASVMDLSRAAARFSNTLDSLPNTIGDYEQLSRNINPPPPPSVNITPGPAQSRFGVVTSASSLQGAMNQGTGLQPGDSSLDRGRPQSPRPLGSVSGTSVREIEVLMNDTIESITARVTGSTADVQVIIALNNLRPPYISTTGIPGTIRPGDPILVPSSGRAAVDKFGPTVYGARLTESLSSRLYGTDLRLDPVLTTDGAGLYDLVLSNDTEDVLLRTGVENLKQGLRTRILTEIGSNPIYPDLGYKRFIGLNAVGFDKSLTRLSLSSAVEADERIITVDNLRVSEPTPDHLSVEFDAIVFSIQDRVQMRIVR